MNRSLSDAQRLALWLTLLALLAVRLGTLGAYPLTDTSEARYGEMVRKMVELSDWVTPWFDYGVPFWGKPPLAFWLSAASAKLLGVSEFAVRLPSFLLGLAMLALSARLATGRDHALLAAVMMASGVLFFVASGAMLTDTALAFAVTLAMTAFWFGVAAPDAQARRWRYLLFVALGLGLLSKGPVALILSGAPVGAWALVNRRLKASILALPWVRGLALTLAITLPWYLLAESRTPGFLEYFLRGENFLRFVDPNWAGDLYGGVHTRPKGHIWLLWLGAAAPWSLLLIVAAAGALLRRDAAAVRSVVGFFRADPRRQYLLCFALAPGCFFTLAGSVLPTYVLPGIPALAVLLAEFWMVRDAGLPVRRLAAIALALPLSFALFLSALDPLFVGDKSQQLLLSQLPPRASVIYLDRRPYSAQFYSEGRAKLAVDAAQLLRMIESDPRAYIVSWNNATLPPALELQYQQLVTTGRKRRAVLWAPQSAVSAIEAREPDPLQRNAR